MNLIKHKHKPDFLRAPLASASSDAPVPTFLKEESSSPIGLGEMPCHGDSFSSLTDAQKLKALSRVTKKRTDIRGRQIPAVKTTPLSQLESSKLAPIFLDKAKYHKLLRSLFLKKHPEYQSRLTIEPTISKRDRTRIYQARSRAKQKAYITWLRNLPPAKIDLG